MRFFILMLLMAQEPLTLQEALRMALACHPAVAAAQTRVRAAEAWAGGAGAQPNPEVRLSGTRGDPGEDANLLAQRLEIAGQTGLRSGIAAEEAEAARHRLQATRRDVARRVATAYYGFWQAGARLEVATQRLGLARQLERASRARLESGEISENAHLRTQFEVARAEADLAGDAAQAEAARSALNLLLGRAPEEPVVFPQADTPEPEAPAGPGGAPGPLPELQALQSAARATHLEAELAGRARAPDVELSAYRSRLFGQADEEGLQLSLVFPLFDYGRISASEERLLLEAEARDQDVAARSLEVRTELVAASGALRAAVARREILRGQVTRGRRLAELATRGYEVGLLSLPEVLDAQTTFRLAMTDFVAAEAAVRQAEVDVHWLSGAEGEIP